MTNSIIAQWLSVSVSDLAKRCGVSLEKATAWRLGESRPNFGDVLTFALTGNLTNPDDFRAAVFALTEAE